MKAIQILFLLLLCSCAHEVKHIRNRGPADTGIDAEKYIKMLPTERLRKAAREYANLIGVGRYESNSLGGSNDGIVAFNWDLVNENKCFREMVSDFYTEVAKVGAQKSSRFTKRADINYNNLSVTTENSSVDTGWLWELAKVKSNGEGNLAMSLIGICGHDNTLQLPIVTKCADENDYHSCEQIFSYIPFNNDTQAKKHMGYVHKEIDSFLKNFVPVTKSNKQAAEYVSGEMKEKFLGSRQQGLTCPYEMSPMFTEGALGSETILNPALRQEISTIQAPTKGAGALPGKYYHTIGAAYATCALVRQGFPGFMVRKIQDVGIKSYRMSRLCDTTSNHMGSYEEASKIVPRDALLVIQNFRKDRSVCVENHGSGDDWEQFKFPSPYCQMIQRLIEVVDDPNANPDILRSKIRRYRTEKLASHIFNEKVLEGKPCEVVQLDDSKIARMKRAVDNPDESCEGSRTKACQDALETLNTWWVDFAWSSAQHKKGADFAIQYCERDPKFISQNLEKKACAALESRSSFPMSKDSEGITR